MKLISHFSILTLLLLFKVSYSCSIKISSTLHEYTLLSARPSVDSIRLYILNPNKNDSTCLNDISIAKEKIKKGKLAYVLEDGDFKRYEVELKKLCKDYDLTLEMDLFGCTYAEGQTYGCYKAYMDMAIIEKYGANFKSLIAKKADSLFLEKILRDKVPVNSWDCDVEPRPVSMLTNYIETTLSLNDFDIIENPNGGTWPSLDINFIINLDKSISTINRDDFMPNKKHNAQFENELFKIAIDYINKKYPKWDAGIILGEPVYTKKYVRITFVKD